MRFVVIRFGGLLSFGASAVGEIRPTDLFPACSMLTGLIANALGLESVDRIRIQKLQNSIILGSRIDQQGTRLMDFQTASIAKKDLMWRSDGLGPESRAGGESSYSGPALRYKHYLSDHVITSVIGLRPSTEELSFSIDEIANAIQFPFRVLFLGRYCCIPDSLLYQKIIEAPSVFSALELSGPLNGNSHPRGEWPVQLNSEEDKAGKTMVERQDLRDWLNDVHAGSRLVWRGPIGG